MGSTAELIQFNKNEIAAFSEFRRQLAQLKHDNEKAVFNYDDPKGNKEARSHVYKLRQTRSAVEKVRKEQKAEALEYGRMVDNQAKEISAEIDGMIDLHEAPLKAIEEKESARIQAHKDRISAMAVVLDGSESSETMKEKLAALEGLEIDDSYQEFKAEALLVKTDCVDGLKKRIEAQEAMEAQQAELERLRKEAAEREQRDRDERIAREAREAAELQAAEKARLEKEASDRREREQKEALERAELAQKEAEQRAEQAKKDAEQRALQAERQAKLDAEMAVKRAEEKRQSELKAEQDAIAKREKDRKHMAAINNEIVAALVAGGIDEASAKAAVTLIAKRSIPHISIQY